MSFFEYDKLDPTTRRYLCPKSIIFNREMKSTLIRFDNVCFELPDALFLNF